MRATQGAGKMPDGTSRFRCNGKELFHFMGCSTFSQYTVVAGVSVCAVNSKAPQDKVFNLTQFENDFMVDRFVFLDVVFQQVMALF